MIICCLAGESLTDSSPAWENYPQTADCRQLSAGSDQQAAGSVQLILSSKLLAESAGSLVESNDPQHVVDSPPVPPAEEPVRVAEGVRLPRPGEPIARILDRQPLESLMLIAQGHVGVV